MVSPLSLDKESVPLLLQAVLVLWDHYTPVVQDQAREMLVHLIHELVISQIDVGNTTPDKEYIEDFIESIRQHSPRVVWAYDDANGKVDEDTDSRVPEAMHYVATEVVKIFSITYPGIREEWGKMTLNWATNCPVRHLACRSFQLFRCILGSLDQNMLGDMLARLSNTISDEDDEIITFSMEILTTLKTVIEALSNSDLIQYPQLFWTACACLQTVHEAEFAESLAILEKLLDKLDLGDPAVLKLLKENYPIQWEGSFDGLAELVYRGVKSSTCYDRTLRILEKLAALPPSDLVGSDNVLLFTILANLPRYLRVFEKDVKDPLALASADNVANIADCKGYDDIAGALKSLVVTRYRTDKDFLTQTVASLRTAFFAENDFKTLVFLMGLLLNNHAWVKIRTMQILCVVIPDVDMKKAEVTSKGSDLISPLLRLLQTEFCLQALQVLDNILTIPLSGASTPLDRHHLRMSMAGSHSSKAFRKEYERTQSLYGIPEETGWSIPMPAVHSAMTRHNVHAVFYSTVAAETATAEVSTPKIEFRAEEYPPGFPGSYFPTDDRTATMTSDATRGDGHIGDLVMTLDSLDDFFDEEDEVMDFNSDGHMASSPGMSRYQGGGLQIRETLYDQQTAPLLHKSLTRNASVGSFQTGFADLKVTSGRDPGVMTPTAFTSPQAPTLPVPRPGMHSRSVTSPLLNQQRTPPGPGPGPVIDEYDESLSDDDLSLSRAPSSNEARSSSSLDHHSRGPFAQTRAGIRSHMRRLTGGVEKDKEKSRDAMRTALQRSPQVPRVPNVYLQNPKSADP